MRGNILELSMGITSLPALEGTLIGSVRYVVGHDARGRFRICVSVFIVFPVHPNRLGRLFLKMSKYRMISIIVLVS